MKRSLALALALLTLRSRRRRGRHLPRLQLRRRRAHLGQQRLEAERRRRRRDAGHRLRRRRSGCIAPAGARDGQQHVHDAVASRARSGTTIADFALTRQIRFTQPGRRRARTATTSSTRSARRTSPAAATAATPRATRSTRSARGTAIRRPTSRIAPRHGHAAQLPGARAATPATPEPLVLRLGCYNRGSASARSPPAARIDHLLHGSDITINDPVAPSRDRRGLRPARRRRRATARTR